MHAFIKKLRGRIVMPRCFWNESNVSAPDTRNEKTARLEPLDRSFVSELSVWLSPVQTCGMGLCAKYVFYWVQVCNFFMLDVGHFHFNDIYRLFSTLQPNLCVALLSLHWSLQ